MERQFRFLKRVANVVSLGEALHALSAGRGLPKRAVAITFDDGYRDNLDLAVPLLERLGLPATFFLVPGILSRSVEAWWEVLAWAFSCTSRTSLSWRALALPLHDAVLRRTAFLQIAELLKQHDRKALEEAVAELVDVLAPARARGELFLDWDGARELVGRGFEVGSHSMLHAILAREQPEEQKRDLLESKTRLEEELGVPVDLLAYPNGAASDFDETTMEAARGAGYSHAVTTVPGWNTADTPHFAVCRAIVEPEGGTTALVRSARYSVTSALATR